MNECELIKGAHTFGLLAVIKINKRRKYCNLEEKLETVCSLEIIPSKCTTLVSLSIMVLLKGVNPSTALK